MKFTLPLDKHRISYRMYPLAPPEGYIAHNYLRMGYWSGLNQKERYVRLELGASFFVYRNMV